MLCHSVFSKGIIRKHTCAQRMSPALSHYRHLYLHAARRTVGGAGELTRPYFSVCLRSWARGLQWNGAYSRISVRILLHPQPPAGLPQRGLQTSPAAQVHWEAQHSDTNRRSKCSEPQGYLYICTYVGSGAIFSQMFTQKPDFPEKFIYCICIGLNGLNDNKKVASPHIW